MNKVNSLIIGTAMMLIGASSHAGLVYEYEVYNPHGSAAAGDIKHVSTRYNTATQLFSWSYTIERRHGAYSNGFWLVVTDGENPKYDRNEYAIIYGDLDNNRLSVYEYSGQNNANSFNSPGNLIDYKTGIDYVDDHSAGLRTISFNIDASRTNSFFNYRDWHGIGFGEHIGVWFHPALGLSASYDGYNLDSYRFKRQGWFDVGYRETTKVPEPGTVALLALGLAGLGLARRRSQA